MSVTIHIIVPDAPRAADWYRTVLGANERGRITLPDGRLIHLELAFGTATFMVADEFPEHHALSPKTTGVTSAVFYLQTDDVDELWARALAPARGVSGPSRMRSGANAKDRSSTHSDIAGACPNTNVTSIPRR